MNCEDVPMSEWDKLTGAAEETLAESFIRYFPMPDNKQVDGSRLIITNFRVPEGY